MSDIYTCWSWFTTFVPLQEQKIGQKSKDSVIELTYSMALSLTKENSTKLLAMIVVKCSNLVEVFVIGERDHGEYLTMLPIGTDTTVTNKKCVMHLSVI